MIDSYTVCKVIFFGLYLKIYISALKFTVLFHPSGMKANVDGLFQRYVKDLKADGSMPTLVLPKGLSDRK